MCSYYCEETSQCTGFRLSSVCEMYNFFPALYDSNKLSATTMYTKTADMYPIGKNAESNLELNCIGFLHMI